MRDPGNKCRDDHEDDRRAGSRRFIEFSLLVPGETAVNDAHRLCDRLEAALQEALPNASVVIHVEPREGPSGTPD